MHQQILLNIASVLQHQGGTFSAPPPAGSGENAVAEGAAIGASVGKAAADKPVEQTLPEIVVKPQKKQSYVSDADIKKQEREQRKAEADRKKKENEERKALHEQSKQLKAEMDNRLAEESVSYSLADFVFELTRYYGFRHPQLFRPVAREATPV